MSKISRICLFASTTEKERWENHTWASYWKKSLLRRNATFFAFLSERGDLPGLKKLGGGVKWRLNGPLLILPNTVDTTR